MKNKPKAAAGKDKPKAKKLNINKDTVQSLSDDELGKAQGGRKGTNTAANCSNPCPATSLLCPHKTTVPAGCPSTVTASGCGTSSAAEEPPAQSADKGMAVFVTPCGVVGIA